MFSFAELLSPEDLEKLAALSGADDERA